MSGLLLIAIVIIAVVFVVNKRGTAQLTQRNQLSLDDAAADARRWIDRLGSQVLTMTGTDVASTQAIADASERFNAASSQIAAAQTPKQAQLARESALEGLYYMEAARQIMEMPAGPELPPLEGQKRAGSVTEERTITQPDGTTITASPVASADTPNYYPGGMVAGRPVPAGWYSTPWWAQAMVSGMWSAASIMMFSSLFHGMAGVGYGADAFASGYGNGFEDGLAAAGGDMGELGGAEDLGDMGGFEAGDGGGFFDGFDGFDFDF
ncbi:MAG: DUF1542 domain-containing protein [Corynebacterium sp.]|nr:DUF1542 domain-containing protein [Corynebacterium sp.]